MNLVIDCSFIMSSIFPDESIGTVGYTIHEIYVPSIFFLECNNVLLNALKRKRISEENYREYSDVLKNLPVTVDNFSTTSESLYFVGKLAKDYDLTAYDASYLELAIRLNAKLATFDSHLKNAGLLNGVILI